MQYRDAQWLARLPLAEMIRRGWVDRYATDAEQVAACLRFFGVSTPDTWAAEYGDILQTVAFRTSNAFKSDDAAVAVWIRQGELEASLLQCKKWDPVGFRRELLSLRALTREKNPAVFLPKLQKRCAAFGVAVLVVRAPTGCRASGVTRVLSRGRRMILLSCRYLSDDHFWFTFFHEAGHLILHSDRALVLEGDGFVNDADEEEANQFAADILIPPDAPWHATKSPAYLQGGHTLCPRHRRISGYRRGTDATPWSD